MNTSPYQLNYVQHPTHVHNTNLNELMTSLGQFWVFGWIWV
jgi:hypothetical protein